MHPERVLLVSVWLCTLLLGFPLHGVAATLDDASIRTLYAEEDKLDNEADKTKDAKKVQAFLQTHLADSFTVTTNTEDIDDKVPYDKEQETHTKAETIANAADNLAMMDTLTSEDKITEIKYSDDHKLAYVSTTSASTGTMHGPGANGKIVTLSYQDNIACVEKLTLENAVIKIMQATCDDKLVTKEIHT